MKKFAVIGNPVDHSLSPLIHQQFANQFDIELEYIKLHADTGQFNTKINEFQRAGGCGLNVTVPYKSEAYVISNQLSEQAALAKAVNTLSFKNNCISGSNTDGIGLVNDLIKNHQFTIAGKSILILGAGGAVSGVLGPLLEQNPASIIIANRTFAKALELEHNFSHLGSVKGCGLDKIEQLKFDLIINGTAASLAKESLQVPIDLFEEAQMVYDMMYSKQPTVFMQVAEQNGSSNTVDGVGMLVEQAAAAFEIWHDVRPETKDVLSLLRA